MLSYDRTGTSQTSFAKIKDFFNPKKNQMFLDSNDRLIRLSYLKSHLNELMRNGAHLGWCLWKNLCDNVIRNPGSVNDLNTWINAIPPEKRWILYFINIDRFNSSQIIFRTYAYNDPGMTAEREMNALGYVRIRLKNGVSSTAVTHQDFVRFLDAAIAKFDEQYPDSTVKVSLVNSSLITTSFRHIYQRYLTDDTVLINDETHEPAPPSVVSRQREVNINTGYEDSELLIGYNFSLTFTAIQALDNRERLYQTLQYSADPLRYISWPKVEKDEKKPILYGVELECSYASNIREIIDAQKELFFIVKSDSSVSGSKRNRGEFVTVPMSLKAHKKHWAAWFSKMDYSNFDISKETSNGMHVHIDRKAFMNDQHLKNMLWFFAQPVNAPFLSFISERGGDGFNDYCRKIRIPTDYSKVTAYKNIYDLSRRERMQCINLTKGPTVEVRLFKGIVSFAELLKNLEFTDAIFHFTEGEKHINKLTFVDFIQWLNTDCPKNKYGTLRTFLDHCKNMDKMIMRAELDNVIFNKTRPDDIISVLNKSSIRLTNEHVTLLNQGGKRAYVLDKETGKLKPFVKPGSRLASLDRVLEKKYTFALATQ